MNDIRYLVGHHRARMKAHWLAKRLKDLGKKNRELAQFLGLPDARISEIIKYKRDIRTDELGKFAEFLNWDVTQVVEALSGRNPAAHGSVKLKGYVQAGAWMIEAHLPEEEWEPTGLPMPPGYENMRPFVLGVRGDSMNEVYPDGTLITCVSVEEVGRAPRNEEHVIVERQNEDGRFETTVKEFRIDGKRKWLVARSTRPEFAGAVEYLEKGTSRVGVVAIVVASYKFEGKP